LYELKRLSSQEYVDEYAQRAKGLLAQALHHDSRGKPSRDDDAGHEANADGREAGSSGGAEADLGEYEDAPD
jgi:hypothetical protein